MSDSIRLEEKRDIDTTLDLALQRTALAWDRTLLSWVRTTLALMGAGIVLAKGAQVLHQAKVLARVEDVRSGHWLGLSLTGISTVLLVIVCGQYVGTARALARTQGSRRPRFPAALLAALLTVLLGCAVFAVLILDRS